MSVSRRTIQRWDRKRERDPEHAERTQQTERVRVDLLAARAAFRRALLAFKEQGGFTEADWAVVNDLHRDVSLLLHPED